jgi:D-3-phosphoglycerate dehydrogenase
MTKLTVVVADPIHQAGIAALQRSYDVRQFRYSARAADKEAVAAGIRDADALVARAIPVTRTLLESAPRLKVIVRHGVGVENIDIAAATALRIPVANCGEANTQAVAEAAVALMLATLRRIPEMREIVVNGTFADDWFVKRWDVGFGQMTGRVLGLVGMGNIARHTGRICSGGFGMRVLAYDPFLSAREIASRGGEKVDALDELMARADIVSIHAPLTPTTRHMIGERQIARMPRHAILVHTSRGGVVDENALANALQEGRIAGAGIDVHETEPPRPGNRLFGMPNVVLTPHVGAGTVEAHATVARQAATIVDEALRGVRPATLLNGEIWESRRR